MKLLNADKAVVEIKKLRDYCLSESHPIGKHKAKVFQMKLGMDSSDAAALRYGILK